MPPVFFVTLVLLGAGVGVTIYALLSAEEGYEDAEGYHSARRAKPQPRVKSRKDDSVPPPALRAH
jgi:hypothetical protein